MFGNVADATLATVQPSLIQVEAGIGQYVATAAVGGLFVLFLYELFRIGSDMKDDHDENLVEIVQALATTAGAILASVFVIFVWGLDDNVEDAYAEFTIQPETAILMLVTLVTVAVTYTLTRVTKRLIRYSSGRIEVTPHQREVLHHAVQLFLFFTAAAFIFALWEFDPTNLLLGAGALGIVLGFAARKTLSGVLSGFVILFGRPFEVGDWIAVGEREGIVTEITVYNTQIRTFNEEHVLIPNDVVTDSEIVNYSKTSRLRLHTEVGVDYDVDVSVAASVATDAMEACDSVASNPKPDVVLESFGDSALVLQLRYWIDRPTIAQKLGAQNEVFEAVKEAFDSEGIKIPYPQRELMGRQETDGLKIATESDASVEAEVERAVRRVTDPDSTAIDEPVERKYAAGDAEEDEESESDGNGDQEGDGTDGESDSSDDSEGDVPDEDVPDDTGDDSDGDGEDHLDGDGEDDERVDDVDGEQRDEDGDDRR